MDGAIPELSQYRNQFAIATVAMHNDPVSDKSAHD